MSTAVLSIIGIVLALAATIVAWILVVPERKRPRLNRFFQWVHDFFNFKSLWLEKILKFLYIFETLFCIIGGLLLMFSFETYSTFSLYGSGRSYTRWNGWVGILLLIFGPIVVRVLYEFVMMIILLVKNTMEINDKLNAQPGSRFEEKLMEAKQREELIAARRAQKAQQAQQYRQAQQYQQAQQFPTYPQTNEQQVPQYQEPPYQATGYQEPVYRNEQAQEPRMQEPQVQEPRMQEPQVQEPQVQEPQVQGSETNDYHQNTNE